MACRRGDYPAVDLRLELPGRRTEYRFDYGPPSLGARMQTGHGMYVVADITEVSLRCYAVRLVAPSNSVRNGAADLLTYAKNAVSRRERRRRTFVPVRWPFGPHDF